MKNGITIRWNTSRGTECSTYSEALVMEALEDSVNLYLEEYKKKDIVNAILSNLTVRIKKHKEPENEPTTTSQSSEHTEA